MTPASDALAQLRDIHLPDPVPFWPPAPGWWIVATVLVALAVAWQLVLRRRRRSAELRALRLLDELVEAYAADGDPVALSSGLSALLRRIGLKRLDRAETAGLHGAERARALAGGEREEAAAVALIESLERVVYAGAAACSSGDEPAAWIAATRRLIGRRR
jgi:hypothetical protein